jgi:hypothetical protein
MAETIFEYCRTRLSLDPAPLDYGSLRGDPGSYIEGIISEQGNDPIKVLDVFAAHLATAAD